MIGDINSRYSISSISNHLAVWHFILLTGNNFPVRFYKDHSTSSGVFHTLKNIAWHDANTFEHLRKAENIRPSATFSWLAAVESNWFPFVCVTPLYQNCRSGVNWYLARIRESPAYLYWNDTDKITMAPTSMYEYLSKSHSRESQMKEKLPVSHFLELGRVLNTYCPDSTSYCELMSRVPFFLEHLVLWHFFLHSFILVGTLLILSVRSKFKFGLG